jgi:stage IV sporulation protein B
MSRNRMNILRWITTPLLLMTLSAYFKVGNIPNTIFLRDGETLQSDYFIKLTEEDKSKEASTFNKNEGRRLDVRVLGVLPVKSIWVRSLSKQVYVFPGGTPIGVKLNTKGVLIVALSDIESLRGKLSSPAAGADIKIGDSIVKINNVSVNDSDQTSKEINKCNGKEITLLIDRKGILIEKKLTPIKSSSDNKYKIGLWIRDSTAGVGTLTFYDESSMNFAALGHPITDVDTGTILNINSGEIVSSSIVSVKKGLKGSPGELKGIFVDENMVLGQIYKNTECGIFGKTNARLVSSRYSKPIPIALRNEIKEGPAKIITTIDGEEPKEYNIVIEKLLSQDTPGPKSMVIRVTDPILLEKTGGIVQGMSGSPIIQDGKLVGAVTHVLINKPDVGYGIYIEWMLKDAEVLSK